MRQLICDSSSSATLSSAKASLCRRKLGERKRKRGGGGGGHDVLLFLGASAEERGSAMYRFLTLNLFLLVAYPQIGSAYAKEGTMTLKYRSNSFFSW